MNIKEYQLKVNTKIIEKDGFTVTVKDKIPYSQKEEMAAELTSRTLYADDELGIACTLPNYDAVRNFIFLKYYTDLDLSWMTDDDDFRRLYDFAKDMGLDEDTLWEFCGHDVADMDSIAAIYADAAKARFEREKSLGYKVLKMLDTSPDTDSAEARELIEKLIDMKGALIEKESKPANGMNVGGGVINFAKKTKN